MTTMPQQPIDSVQVPQAVGLSPEVAFNLVGQAGLAPMFQAQAAPGQAVPGVPSQWGQVPASFAGQTPAPGQPAAQVIAQNPLPGTWVPRGSVVYLEWAEVVPAPPEKSSSSAGWVVAGILAALAVLAGLIWFLTSGGDPEPDPSRSPSATATVTETPSPRPTRTVTETATATATQTSTSTATATATETSTVTAEPTTP